MGNARVFHSNMFLPIFRFLINALSHYECHQKTILDFLCKWLQNKAHSTHNPNFVTGWMQYGIYFGIYQPFCFGRKCVKIFIVFFLNRNIPSVLGCHLFELRNFDATDRITIKKNPLQKALCQSLEHHPEFVLFEQWKAFLCL